MQKYQFVNWKFISGISALFGFLFPVVVTSTEPVPKTVMEHQLGERIDEMENIIPVMERSKTIQIALPYFNRYPHFTENLIGRSVEYFPVIERILERYDLPEDLKYIPLFESGFREDAVSPAGAVGMWQFVEGTGRKYGLTINREIDERLDFIKSTEAAARFLKSLHEELGSWALVLMAYNGGPYRVKRLIRENKTSDIHTIMNQMPQESQTYLSKMVAAKLIFKTYKLYGLTPQLPDPVDFYSLYTTHIASVDLNTISKEYQVDYSVLRQANPHLKYRKIRNTGQHTINIRIPFYAVKDNNEKRFREQTYYISSKEQIEDLASVLNINIRKIELANEYFDRTSLVGKVISIPVPVDQFMILEKRFGQQPVDFLTKNLDKISYKSLLYKMVLISSETNPISENRTLYYLRPSESLLEVANKLKVSLEQIKEMNPGLDLYKSNRFYIPVSKVRGPYVANAM